MKAFWNILFSVAFLALAAWGYAFLSAGGLVRTDIGWSDLALLSLATFRLVRLFTYDHITAFLRDCVAAARPGTLLGTVKDLLGCPWCTGVWFASLVYFGYCLDRALVMPVVLVLAIAALATVFQVFTNLVGWNAEDKKIDVKHKED